MRFLLALLPLLLAACIEDREGCLDLAATNFDVTADIACVEPCCEFPQLQLLVRHRVVSAGLPDSLQRFRYDSVYLLGAGADSIRFQYFRFYLQNLVLELTDGRELRVNERLELFSPTAGALSVTDDVTVVDRDAFGVQVVGELPPEGTVRGLRFAAGLPVAFGDVSPTEFPTGHPLRVGAAEVTYDTLGGYSSLAAAFRVPPGAADSTVVRFLGEVPVALPLGEPVALRRGFDLTIELQLRYDRLLEDVNLAQATEQVISNAIVDRLPNSFEILGVFQE